MTIRQMRKRLDRLIAALPDPPKPDIPHDPALAEEWEGSGRDRWWELFLKKAPLPEDESREFAHLNACKDASARKNRSWPYENGEPPPAELEKIKAAGSPSDQTVLEFRRQRGL